MTGVQTCALPIWLERAASSIAEGARCRHSWASRAIASCGGRSASSMWSHGVADAEGMCHFPPMGGSPCCRGRRRRRGLPHRKSAAAHRGTLAEGYVGKIMGHVLEAPWLVSDSHILQEGIYFLFCKIYYSIRYS